MSNKKMKKKNTDTKNSAADQNWPVCYGSSNVKFLLNHFASRSLRFSLSFKLVEIRSLVSFAPGSAEVLTVSSFHSSSLSNTNQDVHFKFLSRLNGGNEPCSLGIDKYFCWHQICNYFSINVIECHAIKLVIYSLLLQGHIC